MDFSSLQLLVEIITQSTREKNCIRILSSSLVLNVLTWIRLKLITGKRKPGTHFLKTDPEGRFLLPCFFHFWDKHVRKRNRMDWCLSEDQHCYSVVLDLGILHRAVKLLGLQGNGSLIILTSYQLFLVWLKRERLIVKVNTPQETFLFLSGSHRNNERLMARKDKALSQWKRAEK